MSIEIERKFLVNKIPENIVNTIDIKQYYISINPKMVQRLRFFNNDKAIISFKERSSSIAKHEFEYEIPLLEARKLISFINTPFIVKKRHYIKFDSMKWEVDEFLGKNKGLIVAEIELIKIDQKIKTPEWVTNEISKDQKYSNFNLALHPFTLWEDSNE
jgi:CYTH domain-containing protein